MVQSKLPRQIDCAQTAAPKWRRPIVPWRNVQRGRDAYYERLLAGHEPPQKLKSIKMQIEEYAKLFLNLKTWMLSSI